MTKIDEMSAAIGRLEAMQEAHVRSASEFRDRMCARLDELDSKVESLDKQRNRVIGAAAVFVAASGLLAPWAKYVLVGG